MIKSKFKLSETNPNDVRFGLGVVDSYGAVHFKELPKDYVERMTHQSAGLPGSNDRFRYNDGNIEWTDRADDETKNIVTNYLTNKGYKVKLHKSYWWDDDETYPQQIRESELKVVIKEIIRTYKSLSEQVIGLKFWWLDPNLKLHPVKFEEPRYWAEDYLKKLGYNIEPNKTDVYTIMYKLGFIRVVRQQYGATATLNYTHEKGKPITSRQLKELKDLAVEQECHYLTDDTTGRETPLLESMFPKEFDRHQLGSCMAAAELATKYLLQRGKKDFHVVEGWVSLSPDLEEDESGWAPHTWIEFSNGKIFDPTKNQWKNWGYDPAGVKIQYIRKKYEPEEYLDVAAFEPSPWEKFKKKVVKEILAEGQKEKELQLKTYLPHMNDNSLVVTVNKFDEMPQASYVQVDGFVNKENVFSSNPEEMNQYGYKMPSSKELLNLPTGQYRLADVKSKLHQTALSEDMSYEELLKLTTPERKERASNVTARSLPVSVEEGLEQWNFRYKSNPATTVTDKPFRGSITFLKGEVGNNDNAMKLKCKVDCECPDFMYRFAYNDAAKGASQVGPDSLNGALNRRPKPAYDYGEGLCKHLTALGRFLKTKISATRKSNLFEAVGDVAKQGPFNVTYYD